MDSLANKKLHGLDIFGFVDAFVTLDQTMLGCKESNVATDGVWKGWRST